MVKRLKEVKILLNIAKMDEPKWMQVSVIFQKIITSESGWGYPDFKLSDFPRIKVDQDTFFSSCCLFVRRPPKKIPENCSNKTWRWQYRRKWQNVDLKLFHYRAMDNLTWNVIPLMEIAVRFCKATKHYSYGFVILVLPRTLYILMILSGEIWKSGLYKTAANQKVICKNFQVSHISMRSNKFTEYLSRISWEFQICHFTKAWKLLDLEAGYHSKDNCMTFASHMYGKKYILTPFGRSSFVSKGWKSEIPVIHSRMYCWSHVLIGVSTMNRNQILIGRSSSIIVNPRIRDLWESRIRMK